MRATKRLELSAGAKPEAGWHRHSVVPAISAWQDLHGNQHGSPHLRSLFEIQYFDRVAYLAQSPQFYKEHGVADWNESTRRVMYTEPSPMLPVAI